MNLINKQNWWQNLSSASQSTIQQIWIPIGVPGHAGENKGNRKTFLDTRFGTDGWRTSHYVHGRIVSVREAIREYEQSYRVYLHAQPHIVDFITSVAGNVYDDNPTNVHDHDYHQPHTQLNHYQDIAVRRVIAELVDDVTWSTVIETAAEEVDLVDLKDGQTYNFPRARGFRGNHLLQIREPDSPGFCLSPAVVPVHDPALIITHSQMDDWYLHKGCEHLSVEAFWQMSKVVEARYDRFVTLKEARVNPLEGLA